MNTLRNLDAHGQASVQHAHIVQLRTITFFFVVAERELVILRDDVVIDAVSAVDQVK